MTHLEEYGKTEQEVARVKSDISGEKTAEDIEALVEERERLVASLQVQKDAAEGQAWKDDATLDDARKRIQELTDAIEQYKHQITEITGSKNPEANRKTIPDIEILQKSNEPFLLETFTALYGKVTAKKAKQEARLEDPRMLDYQALSIDIDAKKFGEYILNPDTQTIDFEHAKPLIIDLPQFVGRPRHEAMRYIIDTYGSTHRIPGIEYWRWILENPDKAPPELKDGNYHYFPGSVLRDENGRWGVPNVDWHGSRFDRDAGWLVNVWFANDRVVLLEK